MRHLQHSGIGTSAALLIVFFLGAGHAAVAQQTWSVTGGIQTPRQFQTATLLPSGRVLIAGGTSDGIHPMSSAELYDPSTGRWTPAASLNVARMWHTATLLPSGKVLVAGGLGGGGIPVGSAEIYDPAADSWTPTGSLITARDYHTATLLPSGEVLVSGGHGSAGALRSAEIYNRTTETWRVAGSLNSAHWDHTATLLPSGKVLVAGGKQDEAASSRTAEVFDESSGTWSLTGSLGTARDDHTAVLLSSGLVLVAGGRTNGVPVASAELYDPASGAWSSTGSLKSARSGHTATLLPSGKVLAAGGVDVAGSVLGSTEMFDPASGAWTAGANMTFSRAQHTATLMASGRVLAAGGGPAAAELFNPAGGTWTYSGKLGTARWSQNSLLLPNGNVLVAGGMDDSYVPIKTAEIYDSSAGTWSATGDLNVARAFGTATLLNSGEVLVAGGETLNGQVVGSTEIYDPATGLWTPSGSLGTAREFFTATLLPSGKVLVAGGYDSSGAPIASSELFDPVSGTWAATGSMTTARAFHTATLLPSGSVLAIGGVTDSVEIYDPSAGKWTPTSSIPTGPIVGNSATLMPSGMVLVAGGYDRFGDLLTKTELFDPASQTWTATAYLKVARAEHTATLLPSGSVLIAGGYDNSAEIYDPATAAWTVAAPLNEARYFHSATLLPTGRVLLAGGVGLTATTDSTELYDPGLGFDPNRQPVIDAAAMKLAYNANLVLSGSGFRGIPEASGGGSQSSNTNYPLVQLMSLVNEQTVLLAPDPTAGWTDNSVILQPFGEGKFPYGYALMTVITNGIPSKARIFTAGSAGTAVTVASLSADFNAQSQNLSLGAAVADSGILANEGIVVFTVSDSSGHVAGSSVSADVIAGAANATYSLPGGLAGGKYLIEASYSGGPSFSPGTGVGTLSIELAPAISANPQDQTTCTNAFVAFTAAATGSPIPAIQWQLSTDGGVTFQDLPGAVTDTLAFSASSAMSGNLYRVVFTNARGTATSSSAALTVNNHAVFTAGPADQQVCFGGNAAFTAAYSGTPEPVVQWQVSTDGGSTFSDIAGAAGTSLAFTPDTSQNGNLYRAVLATGVQGCSAEYSNPAKLTVSTPPAILSQPVSMTKPAFDSATFSVNVSGVGLSYQWRKNQADITGATQTGLRIAAVHASDAGTYDVVISGGCAPETSASATLAVTPIPSSLSVSDEVTTYSDSAQSLDIHAKVDGANGIYDGTLHVQVRSTSGNVGSAGDSGNPWNGEFHANYNLPAGTAPGSYSIQAGYSGSPDLLPSSGSATLTVKSIPTTITLSDATAIYSIDTQNLTLVARISGAGGKGSVLFQVLDGAAVIGTPVTVEPTMEGIAEATYALPSRTLPKNYSILAQYSTPLGYDSSSAIATLTVNPNPDLTLVFKMPPDAGTKTSSGNGNLSVGYGVALTTAPTNPVLIANFGYSTAGAGSGGALATEAGVPAATPLTSARLVVDFDEDNDSGFALVNPGNTTITVQAEFKDKEGKAVASTSLSLGPYCHASMFASQLGVTLPMPFLGTLTLTSSKSFAATNLSLAQSAHGDPLFSALPVADLGNVKPMGTHLILPQIEDGDGNPTLVYLVNPSGTTPIAGTLTIYDDRGRPLPLDFGPDWGTQSSLSFTIPPDGLIKFATTGTGARRTGYALVGIESGPQPAASSVFQVRKASGLISVAGVSNSPETDSVRMYVEAASAPLYRNTGIAIANPYFSSSDLTLTLDPLDGSFPRVATLKLGARAHVAKLVTDLFENLPANFQGILSITSTLPESFVTLRLTVNERGETIYSTLPVADMNNPPKGAQILPQIVNAGGYKTQVIAINTSTKAGSVYVYLYDEQGKPMPVGTLFH